MVNIVNFDIVRITTSERVQEMFTILRPLQLILRWFFCAHMRPKCSIGGTRFKNGTMGDSIPLSQAKEE